MHVVTLQEDFAKALSTALRFSSPKVQLPVLANVLLTVEKNTLKICATNLEISICISIGAEVQKEGSATIPVKTLFDIISNLPKGKVEIVSEGEKISLSSKGFSGTLAGMNPDDFPAIPQTLGKVHLPIPSEKFSKALSSVLFAVSIDESRPILTGVLCIVKENTMQLVATDGFRLSKVDIPVETTEKTQIIIPKAILQEIMRLKDEAKEFQFSYAKEDNQLICQLGNAVVSSRLIEGSFPDFEKILPKESTMMITVGKNELLRAVKLASVFARDSANVIKVDVGKSTLSVSAESSQKGSQKTEVPAEIDRKGKEEAFVIAFNCKFLEDLLQNESEEELMLSCTKPDVAVLFTDPKERNFLHMIMPVRLQNS